MKLTEKLRRIGAKHDATSEQVALACLLAQGDDIIPIPGTNKVRYLEENIGCEVDEDRSGGDHEDCLGVGCCDRCWWPEVSLLLWLPSLWRMLTMDTGILPR